VLILRGIQLAAQLVGTGPKRGLEAKRGAIALFGGLFFLVLAVVKASILEILWLARRILQWPAPIGI
jgi:hypothetical protein